MIQFSFPFRGDTPRIQDVTTPQWQRDIEEILRDNNIEEVHIIYKKE